MALTETKSGETIHSNPLVHQHGSAIKRIGSGKPCSIVRQTQWIYPLITHHCWWLRSGENVRRFHQLGTPSQDVFWSLFYHCPQCFVRVGWGVGRGVLTFLAFAFLHTCGMLRCTCTHAGCYARKSSLALAHMQDVTLGDLSCTCTHAGCYARKSSLALAHMQDVTLGDLSCTCTHAGCYARKPSLALAHMWDVALGDPLLHLHTCGMLR